MIELPASSKASKGAGKSSKHLVKSSKRSGKSGKGNPTSDDKFDINLEDLTSEESELCSFLLQHTTDLFAGTFLTAHI